MKLYKGKNAIWLIALFIVYNIIGLVFLMDEQPPSPLIIIIMICYYLIDFFWIPILIINRIELYSDYLVFKYGFGKTKVYLKDIVDIHRSHNPIASSANSLDRIFIKTKDREFYVSLIDNDGFIRAINNKRCSNN